MAKKFLNPFRPGAGHQPPYLAGRQSETDEFLKVLRQDVILQNVVLTGLRGVGKTVLLDTWRPLAQQHGWFWAGADLSESISLEEERMARRLITDLSVVTSSIVLKTEQRRALGFGGKSVRVDMRLNYATLMQIYAGTPGLTADKLQATLEFGWTALAAHNVRGVVFAYDEAQNLADHTSHREFPMSLLLNVFQSLQKKGIRFMLALAGLPTLFPKMVKSRTFAERMFHVLFLDRLSEAASREAIQKPIDAAACPIKLSQPSVNQIVTISGGYPYFIQFVCREVYDVFVQQNDSGDPMSVPADEILRKLDSDFFSGRWARATDRQRALLTLIAGLRNCDHEFTVGEIAAASQSAASESGDKPFSPSHISQMLGKLSEAGLVYKNRHGKHSFAVPLLGQFVQRQAEFYANREYQ